MAISTTTISGHYTATWNTKALGQTDDGFVISNTVYHEGVSPDAAGDAEVSKIWRGTDVFISFTGLEYQKLLEAGIVYPVNTLDDYAPGNTMDKVGTNILASCKQLVLTPVGGNANRIFTFYKTILVSNWDVSLSSAFTQVPCTFQAFPDPSNSDKHYAVTLKA